MGFLRAHLLAMMIVVATASHAGTESMNDKADRAHVGQSSRSIGSSVSPNVELAFERALAAAKSKSAVAVTTEHVLLELLHEETVSELLTSASVDVDALRADLNEHLGTTSVKASGGSEPKPEEILQNAMRRAVMKTFTSNQKGASGADLVVALLVEGDSYAAQVLRKYGLTIDFAEDANLERYLTRGKEQSTLLKELQDKARNHRKATSGVTSATSSKPVVQTARKSRESQKPEGQSEDGHKSFILRVRGANGSGENIPFKAALSRNGILDLYIEETPYDIEFVASTVVALFEAIEGGDRLEVQLITELEGEDRSVSGFSGSAGAIFRDRKSVLGQKSGILD